MFFSAASQILTKKESEHVQQQWAKQWDNPQQHPPQWGKAGYAARTTGMKKEFSTKCLKMLRWKKHKMLKSDQEGRQIRSQIYQSSQGKTD